MNPGLPAIGTVIDDKYRLEEIIGAGGMGVVFLATHLKLRERVAIKVLKSEHRGRPQLVERLLREARAAASIRNGHVVRVLDVGTLDDGQPFIVMEHLKGEDLAIRLERSGALPVRDAVDYVLQACEAVAEAHTLGIVHRDLKPANLFLERRASGATAIKVLDFGVARFLASHAESADSDSGLTASHAFVGSPAYVSPEQLTAPEQVDARTDVWALGLILYEMLSASRPFKAATLALTCTKILQHKVPRLARSDAPSELADALERALQKDRELRFPSVLELSQALSAHGSAAARSSLLEIEAVARQSRRPAPDGSPPLRQSELSLATLTGSVVRVQRAMTKLRPRHLVTVALGVTTIVTGALYLGTRAPRAALEKSESARAPAAPTKARGAPAEHAAARSSESSEPVLDRASAGTSSSAPPTVPPAKPPSPNVGAPHHAAAPPPASVTAPPASAATAPRPTPEDDSERLYEFRR